MGLIDVFKRPFLRVVKADDAPVEIAGAKRVSISYDPVGTSGIEIYAGYYAEDYLSSLRSPQVADVFDKMRRSDPQIAMNLQSVKNPIKAGTWSVRPVDDSDEEKKIADLMSHILFNDLPFKQKLSEMLTCLEHGFSVFEMTNKAVIGHKKFGNYSSLRSLGFRSQKTIERWNLDPVTGELLSVDQQAYGDIGRQVTIPGQLLIVFTLNKEGDNYAGISALRPCYGPWKRKDVYLKLMAIGIEKYAIPTPVLDVPTGKEKSEELVNAKEVLRKFISHEQQFITKPADWKLDFTKTEFDASKVQGAIDAENTAITRAFLANFLELGQTGSGSWALSVDLSDFFLTAIQHVADLICETINQQLIPYLCKLNFGPREAYPKLCVTGISDKAGKELSEIVKTLADSKALIPDDMLEQDLRKRYGLPEISLEGQRKQEDPKPFVPFNNSETRLLADKPKTPRALIKQQAEVMALAMQEALKPIGLDLIKQLVSKWDRATDAEVPSITRQVAVTGQRGYKDAVLSAFVEASSLAMDQVRKEVPRGTKKLTDLKLAVRNLGDLPKSIQTRLAALADLLVDSNLNDLQSDILFQFSSSANSTDSLVQLEADLVQKLDKFIEGPTLALGAANMASTIVNETRKNVFEEPEVFEEIESFTFTNPDPETPICQDLAGQTFSKDDPNFDRYYPPLHHNCKSYLVANPKGSKKTVESFGPTDKSLEKFITLDEVTPQGLIAFQAIDVSKEVASSVEDAKRIAAEFTDRLDNHSEIETMYRFFQHDASLFVEGSLKTFSPLKGVTVWYGKLSAASKSTAAQASTKKKKAVAPSRKIKG